MRQYLAECGTFSLQPECTIYQSITKYCENMNRLDRYVDSRGVAPFFGWGGEGGGQCKKKFLIFFGALRAHIRNIKVCTHIARRKIENCVCLVVFLC